MRKTIYILLVLLSYTAYSQSLFIYDIDTKSFPIIKAKFYALDAMGNQITNLSPSDFLVTENGEQRNVINITCPKPKPPIALSSVLTIDVSGSMKNGGMVIAKEAAKVWVNCLPLGSSECAITSFDHLNYLNHIFTTNRDTLLNTIEKLTPFGGTDYDNGLLNPNAGSLVISKDGKYKRVVIFLTDGVPLKEPQVNAIIAEAKRQNCVIYAVVVRKLCPQCLKDITVKTGGEWFENIQNEGQAKDIYLRILKTAQGAEPCEIEWESKNNCKFGSTNLEIDLNGVIAQDSYIPPDYSVAIMDIIPSTVTFLNAIPGIRRDTTITVSALNVDYNVTDITSNNPAFTITPKSFSLSAGQSRNLTLSFLPVDSSFTNAKFKFAWDNCIVEYDASGGFKGVKPAVQTLALTNPNGWEKFVIGSDTLITWKGIPEIDTVRLEYSIDNGKNWTFITDTATGLKYLWQKIPRPPSNECLVKIKQMSKSDSSQFEPPIEWQKTYGGSGADVAFCIQQTFDGGYIVAGKTSSNDGDVTENKGNDDVWLIKLDGYGNKSWQKTYGGSTSERANSIQQTRDLGYIVAGYRDMVNGKAALVMKLDVSGNLKWEITYVKNNNEFNVLYSVQETKDDGYIIAGITSNMDESSEYLILKVNKSGNIEWKNTYNKFAFNGAHSIQETNDGGYIVAGWTSEKKVNNNLYYIIKLDRFGDKVWDNTYGIANDFGADVPESIQQTTDGGYIVAGSRMMNAKPCDYLLIKIDSVGNQQWERTYGGSGDDYAHSIKQTIDGGYIVAGYSSSEDGDVIVNKGLKDGWLIKLNKLGAIQWQKTIGGSGQEFIQCINQTTDGGYIIAGNTESDDVTESKKNNSDDVYIVKLLSELQVDESDEKFSIIKSIPVAQNIDMKKCPVSTPKDSIITNFIYNAGECKFRVHSIYFRGDDANAFFVNSGFPRYNLEPAEGKDTEFEFIPTRVGMHQAEIVIITQSDTLYQTIQGEGIKITPTIQTTTTPFTDIICEYSNNNKISISNPGGDTLRINEIRVKGSDNTDFSVNEILPIKIAPDSKKSINVTFKPKTPGIKTADLEIQSNADPDSLITIPISARKDSVNLSYIETKVDLGYLCPNESKDTIINIKNLGTIKTGGFLIGSSNLVLSKNELLIPQLNSEAISFIFSGLNAEGDINETISITDSICGFSKTINIIGKVALPKIDAQPLVITSIVNVSKQGILTIKNSGDRDVEITNAPILNAPFSLVGNPFPATIKAKDSLKVIIEYLPTDTQNNTAIITLSAEPCSITQDINIQGVPISVDATLRSGSTEGYPGDIVEVPIILSNETNLQIAGITGFDVDLIYNSTLLVPLNHIAQVIDNTNSKIKLTNLPMAGVDLAKIKFTVGLGNAESCDLILVDAKAIGGTATIQTESGTFKLLGICREGGTRLFNPTGKAEILSLNPNPASDYIEINVNLIEDGVSTVSVYNLNGVKLKEFILNNGTGLKTINLELKEFDNGLYFIELLTPTFVNHQKLMIVK